MTAYALVMGTLLLAPWVLFGIMMVGTVLSSLAAEKRRPHRVILPATLTITRRSS